MATKQTQVGFSDFEKEAMRNRARELKAEQKANRTRAQGEADVQAAIAAMPQPDKDMAKKVHQLVSETAPDLMPKTWYGMPAYANKDGKVVCFFQSGNKYEARYCTLGFNDASNLDDGNMWAASFALVKLTGAEEKKIVELVKKAVR